MTSMEPPRIVQAFGVIAELSEDLTLKWSDLQGPGADYEFLKCRRVRTDDATYIQSNKKYLEKVLGWLGMDEAKAAPTPGVEAHSKNREISEDLDAEAASLYTSCVLCLLFYMHDREDAQFEIDHLCGQIQAPKEMDMAALKRLCRYLLGTADHGVKMSVPTGPSDVVELDVYTDSDWCGSEVSRQSQTSVHIVAGGAPLVGISCRQDVLSLSTCEAEWHAGARGLSEGLGLRALLMWLGYAVRTKWFCDSRSARAWHVARVQDVSATWPQQLCGSRVSSRSGHLRSAPSAARTTEQTWVQRCSIAPDSKCSEIVVPLWPCLEQRRRSQQHACVQCGPRVWDENVGKLVLTLLSIMAQPASGETERPCIQEPASGEIPAALILGTILVTIVTLLVGCLCGLCVGRCLSKKEAKTIDEKPAGRSQRKRGRSLCRDRLPTPRRQQSR